MYKHYTYLIVIMIGGMVLMVVALYAHFSHIKSHNISYHRFLHDLIVGTAIYWTSLQLAIL